MTDYNNGKWSQPVPYHLDLWLLAWEQGTPQWKPVVAQLHGESVNDALDRFAAHAHVIRVIPRNCYPLQPV